MRPAARAHRIRLPELDREIECGEDENLFTAARRAGVRIVGACGGRGACGSCMVRVTAGRVHREGEVSQRKWLRACCLQPRSDLTLEVAPRSLAPVVRTEVGAGGGEALALDPAVAALEVRLAPPTLQDPASDTARLRRGLLAQQGFALAGVDPVAARDLPGVLRGNAWAVEARVTRRRPPLAIGFAAPGAPLLGLAVDLGSTNVAAFLIDLRTGHRLASLGIENPQVAWGADLVSRMDHAIAQPAAAVELQRAAVRAIAALAHDLARSVGAQPTDIVDAVVCGNTAMQHLLAGWPVAQLGRSPFVAAFDEAAELAARELGLGLAPGARVHLAPSVGGFVGGDHVAALLATEALWSGAATTLVVDIGTNTEISLVHAGRIWSASCPSGPALEGGHITSGMRAAEGAIERVAVRDGRLQLQVIGGVAPVGLCGSGVLDALAAFVGAGWVDARGRIVRGGEQGEGGRAITLAAETPKAPAVRLTQQDVRAVQLAKSAIRTGVKLLAAEAGTGEQAIERCVIAGAFGAHVAVDSAVAIGLLPPLPRERFVQVGNAAGLGVQQMLASRARRFAAAALARRCRYVELGSRADFQKGFLAHIGFGP